VERDVDTGPELVPTEAVARMLSMTPEAVRAAAREGRIPRPIRIGHRTVRFDKGQVTAWIAVRLADAKKGGGAA